ncbi:MAG: MraY family glycosyltransferase, partial [Propionicimonas sp.]|nr:MraY family glycosyltransferase [Propionicimonas sp.]
MREYLLVLLVAAGVTYLLSNLARRLAFRFNAVALVRDRDVHTRPIPYFGGISMCLGLAAAFLVSGQLPWLGGFESVRHDAQAILLAGTLICAVGVVDDLLELNAIAKIAGQLLAAGVVVMNGVKLYWIPLPDAILSLDDGASIAITVVLIFVAVNAINLIDGLDGLAAGVVAIGSGAFFLYAYLLAYEQELVRATPASLVTVATLGICLGFLPYNVHPARMFMGDSGAML